MKSKRRTFLSQGTQAIASAAVCSATSFACSETLPEVKSHVAHQIFDSGDFDLVYGPCLEKQIAWTHGDDSGSMVTKHLLSEGESISHTENPLVTWYFHQNDDFLPTGITSQIDEKCLILSRRNTDDDFVSLAVLRANQGKPELLGTVSAEQLLNDPENPLPFVSNQDESLSFHAAIGNQCEGDVFTCILASRSLFVVVAFHSDGLPRILYFLNALNEGQNAFDPDNPQYQFAPDFSFSFPKWNLTNDGHYSVFFKSYTQGLFLFHFSPGSLKLAQVFHSGDQDGNGTVPFLSFPDHDFNWHVQLKSKNENPSDFFIQALYNMGNAKETLLHWRVSDGHHIFVAVHKTDSGNYQAYPRAVLRAHQRISAHSDWILRPFDKVNTIVCASHGDGPDHLIFWNDQEGVFLFSLEETRDGLYDAVLLREIALDEKFHRDDVLKFQAGDDFYFANHGLTAHRRSQNASVYQHLNAQPSRLNLLEDKNQDLVYRMHLHSSRSSAVFSMDYKRQIPVKHNVTLFRNSHSDLSQVKFSGRSAIKTLHVPEVLGLPSPAYDPIPSPEDAAQQFWGDYCNSFIFGRKIDEYFVVHSEDWYEHITKACSMYRDRYNVSGYWIERFRHDVEQLKNDASGHQNDADLARRKAMVWGASFLVGVPIVTGLSYRIYQIEYNWIMKQACQSSLTKCYNQILKLGNKESIYARFQSLENSGRLKSAPREIRIAFQETYSVLEANAHSGRNDFLAVSTSLDFVKVFASKLKNQTGFEDILNHLDLSGNHIENDVNCLSRLRTDHPFSLFKPGPGKYLAGTFFVAAVAGSLYALLKYNND